MSGEGDMLHPVPATHVTQSVRGNGNKFTGMGNIREGGTMPQQLLDVISEQNKMLAKSQEQIDRLLGLLEERKKDQQATGGL